MNDTTAWDRAIKLVEHQVAALNETLGFAADDKHRVTFGYIGNCEPFHCELGSRGDSRLWSVYLPHPDRYGTDKDKIGSVSSGDASGMAAIAGRVAAFRQGIEWATAQHGMSQHELVKVRNEQVKSVVR